MDVIQVIGDLMTAVIPLVAMVLLYRSHPPVKSDYERALKAAEKAAKKTGTPLDDLLVDGGQLLVDLLPDDRSVREIDVSIKPEDAA